VAHGAVNNSIVWGNVMSDGFQIFSTNNYGGGTFTSSCATPLPGGADNIFY